MSLNALTQGKLRALISSVLRQGRSIEDGNLKS